jgi:hypothetical protein
MRQWEDKTIELQRYHDIDNSFFVQLVSCGAMDIFPHDPDPATIYRIHCTSDEFNISVTFALCEHPRPDPSGGEALHFPVVSHLWPTHRYVHCPLGHVTHTFLACDVTSSCWSRQTRDCEAPLTPLPPSYACEDGLRVVPYALVCDSKPDCVDGSDEDFCHYPPCPYGKLVCSLGLVSSLTGLVVEKSSRDSPVLFISVAKSPVSI